MIKPSGWAIAVTAGILCLGAANSVAAQEKTTAPQLRTNVYDPNREVTLVGTVLKYAPGASGSPGAHVTLQTNSGTLDIHLGDPRFLAANHFTVHTGDTLRIIGETVSDRRGTQFLARIVQDGTNALAVRTSRGLPMSYAISPNPAKKQQGGAL